MLLQKIKSFQRLFFIIIVIFYSVLSVTSFAGALDEGEVGEKIAPELEKIESLGRKPKAELNIEITKIKSESLNEVYIDKKNKNIYVDFSKKIEKSKLKARAVDEVEKKYNIYVSPKIQSYGEVVKGAARKARSNNSNSINYEIAQYGGKEVLKIPYENEPENLYITVMNEANTEILKIYSLDIKLAKTTTVTGSLIEEKSVIVNLEGGIENWQDSKFVFTLNGELTEMWTGSSGDRTENVDISKVQIIKKSGFVSNSDGFINSFKKNVNISLKSSGMSREVWKGDQVSDEARFQYSTIHDNDELGIKYLNDGNLVFFFSKIKSTGRKSYVIDIEHIETETGNRKKHTLIINSNGESESIPEFEYSKSLDLGDIIIREDGSVEVYNSWIEINQKSIAPEFFPVITINKADKWSLESNQPLIPIDVKPMGSFNLNGTSLKVPITIRETPYQSKQKFFIYNRGASTTENLGIGGFTSLGEDASSNRVRGDFVVNFTSDIISTILKYASTKTESKVKIPWEESLDNKIYLLKGEQKSSGNRFVISAKNELERLEFPNVYVVKDTYADKKSLNIKFNNPVPKASGNLTGTFDIFKNGDVAPNNMAINLAHPNSLNVTGIIDGWNGYSDVKSVHTIKTYLNGVFYKEIRTDLNGHLKEEIEINSGENTYVLMKGKSSALAVGLRKWGLRKASDRIELEHLNSYGKILSVDRYNVEVAEFTPRTYLNEDESTLIPQIESGTKTLNVAGKINETTVYLGTLGLENYDKEITKTYGDNVGVRIEVTSSELISTTGNIRGKLLFSGDKSTLINPKEIESLRFVLSTNSGEIKEGTVYTFENVKISIKATPTTGVKEEIIVNRLKLKWTDLAGGDLNVMAYTSTIKDLEITDNYVGKVPNLSGIFSLMQYGTFDRVANIIPAIGLGDESRWSVNRGTHQTETWRSSYVAEYESPRRRETFQVKPELVDPKVESGTSAKAYLYSQRTTDNKLVTVASYTLAPNQSAWERVTTGLNIDISTEILENLQKEAREISGARVEFKPKPGNNNKVAFIIGRNESSRDFRVYLPLDSSIPATATRVKYMDLPKIVITKDALIKNVDLLFNGEYKNEKIVATNSNTIIPTGVEKNIFEDRALLGLKYKHKIRITLPNGESVVRETDNIGALKIENLKIEKNQNSTEVNLNYSSEKTEMWLTNINGNESYNISIEHLDPSGDARRTYNVKLETKKNIESIKKGEMDLIISSRYNPAQSSSVVIGNLEIRYPKETLDIKLLSGDYPEKLSENVFINENAIEGLVGNRITLANGTIVKILRLENGDMELKPLFWTNNKVDRLTIIYRDKSGKKLGEYVINIKSPEFFVAAIGELDFGKIPKNHRDIKKGTNIELWYNSGTIKAEYSIDVGGAASEPNTLYLNDEKTLVVKDLKLGPEIIDTNENRKRTLYLEGRIPEVSNVELGKYQKTIEILIHLK